MRRGPGRAARGPGLVASAAPRASYTYDAESGLYYCSARYYDPATRQWTTGDPAKADGEESSYQYCAGNPVADSDPSGEWSLGNAFKKVGDWAKSSGVASALHQVAMVAVPGYDVAYDLIKYRRFTWESAVSLGTCFIPGGPVVRIVGKVAAKTVAKVAVKTATKYVAPAAAKVMRQAAKRVVPAVKKVTARAGKVRSPGKDRVFWYGGPGAKAQAMATGRTVNMTRSGRFIEKRVDPWLGRRLPKTAAKKVSRAVWTARSVPWAAFARRPKVVGPKKVPKGSIYRAERAIFRIRRVEPRRIPHNNVRYPNPPRYGGR